MKLGLLARLRCPKSGQPLSLELATATQSAGGEINSGWLVSADGQHRYPIRGGIPRFVPESNYADNFGMQWNHFAKTQFDSHSGHPISAERFWKATAWRPEDLRRKWVLDVGCGSGRFAEVALAAGAHVVALDYSSAVDACYANLKHHPDLHVVQGDIMQFPFRRATFDRVYSIGALHHTPDTEQAFHSTTALLKPGGRVSIWVYHTWCGPDLHGLRAVHARLKGWISDTLRRITTKLPNPVLRGLCYLVVPLGACQRAILGSPAPIRALLSPLLLVFCSTHPRWRVRVCDTFDWYSPQYQHRHTVEQVQSWFRSAGLTEISTAGFPVTVRGRRPPALSGRPLRQHARRRARGRALQGRGRKAALAQGREARSRAAGGGVVRTSSLIFRARTPSRAHRPARRAPARSALPGAEGRSRTEARAALRPRWPRARRQIRRARRAW